MKRFFPLIAFAVVLTGASRVAALEVPLEGAGGSGGGAKIGYVDMDRIFQVFPQTQAAKEDYMKQLKKKREQLAGKETELNDLASRISVLESTLKDFSAGEAVQGTGLQSTTTATATTPGSTQSVAAMKKELEDRKAEYAELRKQATADLTTFQSQKSQMILGKIYQALRDLALEEQVAVVVDKSSILYGDAAIDLTEKLQERVRGY